MMRLQHLLVVCPSSLRFLGCLFIMLLPIQAETTYFTDNFSGSDYSRPLWVTRTPEQPWKVVEDRGKHALVSGGKKSWDILMTKDFIHPIFDGVFEFEVKVRFNSDEILKDGLNQFEIYLTDSIKKDGSGYRLSIAQGTTANSALRKKTSEGYATIAPMQTKHHFSTSEYTTVNWSRTSDGSMIVTINGTPYFTANDPTYERFDTLSLGTVLGGRGSLESASPLVIYFTDIKLQSAK